MTVNELFGTSITTEAEMEAWIKERRPDPEIEAPANGEEMSLARVGRDLYEKVSKIFKSTGSNNHDAVIISQNSVQACYISDVDKCIKLFECSWFI